MRAIPRWIQALWPQCAAGQTPCGSVCVDLQVYRDNCGACGTVCGYCGSGSCSSPGSQTYDNGTNGPNCGSDSNGGIYCITVMWECLR